jgi:3-oxoacyl-[acyl-carrier-protein] synthase II
MIATDIVITGTGLITPLGLTRDATWEAVCAGRCGMGAMSAMESVLPPGRDGGQVPDLPPDFEPSLPREARYLRKTILDALADAKFAAERIYSPSRCAMILGTTLHGMRAGGRFLRSGNLSDLGTFLAGDTLQLARRGLGFDGLSATTCSACSSSLGSIALAATLLKTGACDLVLAGGYDTISEYVYGGFNSLRLVAEGPLRPFSRGRQGMKLAEGYGVVVLERRAGAMSRGAPIRATILGWGESADAHHLTQPHPQGLGAARAMRQAIERAKIDADQIDFIAAHATGTPDNDAAEYAAMSNVFAKDLNRPAVVGLKSHLGHTLGAAGAVELILSLTAMEQQTAPPTANVRREDIEFAELNIQIDSEKPMPIRHTLNTSLGFGGANTCVILARPDEKQIDQPIEKRKVFITGIGMVLPGAMSNEAVLAQLNRSGSAAWEKEWPRVEDAELEGLLNARRVRRMSEYVRLQLAAAALAVRDAGVEKDAGFFENCSAILGTMHGSATYSLTYYEQIVREGIEAANPMLFAEGVPNAGSAQLSLMLGIKGACQTIIGTRTSGLDALGLAAARIASGVWDRAIIGAAEEKADILQQAYQHCRLAATGNASAPFGEENGFVLGSGAVAMVLESQNSIDSRGGRSRARVIDWQSGAGEPKNLGRTMAERLKQLGRADVAIASACGTWIDRAELGAIKASECSSRISAIYGQAPELFSAGPLLGLAATILQRRAPGTAFGDSAESVESVISLASDFSGCASAAKVELTG